MAEKSTFIKLDRNITEWRWYQDANTFRVFLHLLIKANIKDKDFENITVHRGELVTSYPSLATALGLSVQNVRTALEHLKKTGELTVKPHSKFSVISIKNYDFYQSNYDSQQTTNSQLTGNQQGTNSQLTTIKESKNTRIQESNNMSVSPAETKQENSERLTDGLQQKTDSLKKPLLFSAVLYKMGSNFYQEGYESEQELAPYDMEDREVQNCSIPYEFKNHTENMQNALKYLSAFSNTRNAEFKEFAEAVITCLSETVCTGMSSYTESVSPEGIIDQLNEINRTVSLGQWLEAFAVKYSRILETSGGTIRNRHGYLKACAVKYLTEYRASEIVPGFKS